MYVMKNEVECQNGSGVEFNRGFLSKRKGEFEHKKMFGVKKPREKSLFNAMFRMSFVTKIVDGGKILHKLCI